MPEKIPQYIFKLALLGDPMVGKTSLITQYVEQSFKKDYKPTLGVNIVTKDISDENTNGLIRLVLWDIAGQKEYDFSRKMFFQGCTGALFVYDITRYSTFESIKSKWLNDLKAYANKNAAYLLIANKTDLKESRAVSIEEGKDLASQINANDFIETSAKHAENVEMAFKKIVYQVLSDICK